jgi:hypothetical protein
VLCGEIREYPERRHVDSSLEDDKDCRAKDQHGSDRSATSILRSRARRATASHCPNSCSRSCSCSWSTGHRRRTLPCFPSPPFPLLAS